MFLSFFIYMKSISKQSIADTGSPCCAPFLSLKYFVEIPPFITFKNILIQPKRVFLNPNFSRALTRSESS